ncbi:diguanylate cyclase [Candidatus Dependentiae bacterium]|nr:diguanylate cyclase [Candidatus Dependentiae bacterium]
MKKIIDHSKITLLFDIKNVARLILQNILNECNCDKGMLLFLNIKKNTYNIIEYSGFSAKQFYDLKIDLSFLDKTPVQEEFTKSHKNKIFETISKNMINDLEKILIFPINFNSGRRLGFLILLADGKKKLNNDITEICRNHIQILVNNINSDSVDKIGEFDMFDSTTQLYNQDFLYENLYRKIIESERTNSKFSLALIEIKNFNEILSNKQNLSNVILKSLSGFLKKNLRKIDILAMLYNAIISIIFADMDHDKTLKKLEELKIKLSSVNLTDENNNPLPKIEMIYGIAEYPDSGKNCEMLIRSAIKSIV